MRKRSTAKILLISFIHRPGFSGITFFIITWTNEQIDLMDRQIPNNETKIKGIVKPAIMTISDIRYIEAEIVLGEIISILFSLTIINFWLTLILSL